MVEIVWPGKYDEQGQRAALPRPGARIEVLEEHDGSTPSDSSSPDRLILGDNLLSLDALLGEGLAGTVDLVYLDPPFCTGGRFSVSTRIGEGRDGRPPPEIEAPAYDDRFEGGVDGLLSMLDPRLRLVHELLAPHGSLYMHVDPTVGHAVKLLLDEVFGPQSFQREIVWRIGWVSGFKSKARNWIRNHDLLFFYTKDPKTFTFNKLHTPYPPGYTRRDGSLPKGKGMPIEDVWNANETELGLRGRESLDSIQIKSFSGEKSGYATQKNESLLRRVIEASSRPGDLVLDPFCGSGTTGVAARELGRRFIGCDASNPALHIAKKRLLSQSGGPSLRLESVREHQWQSVTRAPSGSSSWVSRAWKALQVSKVPEQPGRLGTRGELAVALLPPEQLLDAATLEHFIEQARQAGRRRLEVIARRFELPWPRPGRDLELRLLAVGDEWLEPAQAAVAAGLRELPEVDLSIEAGVEPKGRPGIAVALQDLRYQAIDRWPDQLSSKITDFADLVDAWWVQCTEPQSCARPDVHAFRTHQRRSLSLQARVQLQSPDFARIRIRIGVMDVLHQRTSIEIPARVRVGDGEVSVVLEPGTQR